MFPVCCGLGLAFDDACCIPTRNRSSLVCKCVSAFIVQYNDFSHELRAAAYDMCKHLFCIPQFFAVYLLLHSVVSSLADFTLQDMNACQQLLQYFLCGDLFLIFYAVKSFLQI